MLFSLLPIRDGAALLLFIIVVEPDSLPRGVLFLINDADAGVMEPLVSCAMFPSSFGTHWIERPMRPASKGTARHFWPTGQACSLYFPSLPHVAICSFMQTVACVFIFKLHAELGFIIEKNLLNSDADARLLLGVAMSMIVGGAVAFKFLRCIENGAWRWLREGVAIPVEVVT